MYLSEMETTEHNIASDGPSHAGLGLLHHIHGGLYNDSCESSLDCFTNFNLLCKEGLCVCIKGFVPDPSGACHISTQDLMVLWAIRFAVTAAVLIFCVIVLYFVFNRGVCCCCRGHSDSSRNLLGGEADPASETCWQESPPPYLEVACPPPSYSEAIAKMAIPPSYGDDALEITHTVPHIERSNSICNVHLTSENASKRDRPITTSKRVGEVSGHSTSDVGNNVALHL